MNRDDVIRMAWDAGVWIPMGSEREKCVDTLQRFAAMVAAAEREACAKQMDAIARTCREENSDHEPFAYAAAVIRARGAA